MWLPTLQEQKFRRQERKLFIRATKQYVFGITAFIWQETRSGEKKLCYMNTMKHVTELSLDLCLVERRQLPSLLDVF